MRGCCVDAHCGGGLAWFTCVFVGGLVIVSGYLGVSLRLGVACDLADWWLILPVPEFPGVFILVWGWYNTVLVWVCFGRCFRLRFCLV